jgi:chorismate mutase
LSRRGTEGPSQTNKDDPMTAITLQKATDAETPDAQTPDAQIADLRARIDEIDASLIALWQERAALSQQVGATRVAAGGTRLVLSREREILERFASALGADGTQLALLVLRAGRGPL